MKAALIYQKDGLPYYADVPEPIPGSGNILVSVKAVALKHFDKSRATGNHYSSTKPNATGRIPGGDGICILPDGRRVYGVTASGMMAEKALLDPDRIVAVPDALDDATAAALPNAVIGSAMAMKFRAAMQVGDVVLINGASGFTGRVAIQLARHYGAKKVIATARNEKVIDELLSLGADEVIGLNKNDAVFKTRIQEIHKEAPVDLVIDYLWGRSAEILLDCFKGAGAFSHRTRYVSVGAITGDEARLSSELLRSTDLHINGSGLGSWTKEQVKQLFTDILPEAFQLAAEKKLTVDTISMPLSEIGNLWNMDVPSEQRLVVTI